MTTPLSRVRRAGPGDLEFLVAAQRAMARETEGRALDPAAVRAGVEAVLDDPVKGFYLVADWEREPAGCLLVTAEWSDWRAGWIWWIQSVWVAPQHRRRGIYRHLHEEVLARAAADGAVRALRLYVVEGNAAARKTYEALGMRRSAYLLYEQEFPHRP